VAPPAPRAPRHLARRDALRLLAASTGAVAGGSLIVSGQAHAAVGSVPCGFTFTGSPVVTVTAFNTSFIGHLITLSMSSIPGSCQCACAATFDYAFHLTTPITTGSTGPWSPSNTASASFANLWPAGGGAFTVSAGLRVTCTGPSGTTVTCRYQSATFTMPPSFGQVDTSFLLSSDPGSPGDLPPCEPAALRIAALATGPRLVPGEAPIPPELQAVIDGAPEPQPLDPLAEPARTAEPSPTTTAASEPASSGTSTTSTPGTSATTGPTTPMPDSGGSAGAATSTTTTTSTSTTTTSTTTSTTTPGG
jgi:hypothetical protein